MMGTAVAQNPTAPAKTDAPAASAQKMDLKGSYRSSKLIGLNVYNDADEKLGDVNELIIDRHGKVSAVIIGVGGFLGMGAKPVAVAASDLDFMRDENGDVHAVTNWTKDQLEKMPEHKDMH